MKGTREIPATLQRPAIGSWPRSDPGKLQTATIHEQVFNELRTAIMCGSFAPGEAMTIRDLARTFGISPMPVRDALGRLVAEKAIEMPNSRSFRVPRMTYQEYVELCDFRAVVEGYALERAHAHPASADLDESERLNESFAGLLKDQRYADALVVALRFMFSLYRGGTADRILLPHVERLWLRSGPILPLRHHAMFSRPDGADNEVDLHRRLLAALRARKIAKAVELLRQDIQDNYRLFLREADFAGAG